MIFLPPCLSLPYLIQKEFAHLLEEALSIKSSCHSYQHYVFCHQPRNHYHHQGSGVELELGDSTSLEWEEEFVLAAQRSFRRLQK